MMIDFLWIIQGAGFTGPCGCAVSWRRVSRGRRKRSRSTAPISWSILPWPSNADTI